MFKTAEECFKAVDKQGWNKLNIEAKKVFNFTFNGQYVEFFYDSIGGKRAATYFHVGEICYDKTPKNFCRCIAELKVKNENGCPKPDSNCSECEKYKLCEGVFLEYYEKQIRIKLLIDPGDNWLEKIQEFLK